MSRLRRESGSRSGEAGIGTRKPENKKTSAKADVFLVGLNFIFSGERKLLPTR